MPDAYGNFTAYEDDCRGFSSPSTSAAASETESVCSNDYANRAGEASRAARPSPRDDRPQVPVPGDSDDTSSARITDEAKLTILVQPVEKFRFRYKSEMLGNYGTLFGQRLEGDYKKQVPTVQITNCPFKIAVIRCTIVTVDEDKRYPHAHHLVKKNSHKDADDPHDLEVTGQNNFTAKFFNMGIIHTAKRHIKDEIVRKRRAELLAEKERCQFGNVSISIREDLQIKSEAEAAQRWMNLNSVCLCFQGFFYGDNNVLYPFTEKVYSRPINNLKSALTGEVKICRIDKQSCSCEGNEEVFLLVEKVGKKNIKVKFYEVDSRDNVIWEAYGRFSELDVHHQYAIVFKTPPYKDPNLTSPKEVFVKLERPSDGEFSNSVSFVYKPLEKNPNRKRARPASSGEAAERICINGPTINPSLDNNRLSTHEALGMNLDSDTSGLSGGELKELLYDTGHCDADDLKAYFSDLAAIESYLNLLSATSSACESSDLVTDGDDPEEFEARGPPLARDVLGRIGSFLKAGDSRMPRSFARTEIELPLEVMIRSGDTALQCCSPPRDELTYVKLWERMVDSALARVTGTENNGITRPLQLLQSLRNRPDNGRTVLGLGADTDPRHVSLEAVGPLVGSAADDAPIVNYLHDKKVAAAAAAAAAPREPNPDVEGQSSLDPANYLSKKLSRLMLLGGKGQADGLASRRKPGTGLVAKIDVGPVGVEPVEDADGGASAGEKLRDEHAMRIKDVLERTGDDWEKLARRLNQGPLAMGLYRKTSSPCSALINKIRLQHPEMTVGQMKKLLLEVEAFEAASALDQMTIR